MGLEEEIEEIEDEIANTPYNKSTEAHIGRLKSKLAEKKEKLQNQSSAGGGTGYSVEKHGDATVALVGFPSVGKSSLLNSMTNAESETGSYEFTTLDVNPGMLQHRGANIQMLDVPGLIEGAASGRGDGQQVLAVVRNADLIVFMLSVFEIDQYDRLQEELYDINIRVDREPPRVTVRPKIKDGIKITSSTEQDLDEETIKQVLREHGYVNAVVNLQENVTIDRLVDGLMENREYIPSITCVNKVDLIEPDYKETVDEQLRERDLDPEEVTFISAEQERGLEVLKDRIWENLGLIRVYMDKPGRGIDWEEPLVIERGTTVGEAIEKLGGEMEERFRFARVTGPSATHDQQQVGKDHVLEDEDVLKLILRR
ncbi:small GTP-binding protein [Haloterrigena turkmenica DSM 5511]|uniref:Small GTP-binding protein n=1 Tax=Haloterrigena turkmenica (strain ATCC 51198 / DSM 5511 / JCM 9101 / NCIMB 13204 / VKM B-1734 / 4k) TaxID=543526 RepID=D2RVA6_HALTV|nr:GTP-binding protein [Haloterrigena turkmenica]ADB61307.1 small GTP-binding protein [Haloterrigena turkmenica DSM 5511]